MRWIVSLVAKDTGEVVTKETVESSSLEEAKAQLIQKYPNCLVGEVREEKSSLQDLFSVLFSNERNTSSTPEDHENSKTREESSLKTNTPDLLRKVGTFESRKDEQKKTPLREGLRLGLLLGKHRRRRNRLPEGREEKSSLFLCEKCCKVRETSRRICPDCGSEMLEAESKDQRTVLAKSISDVEDAKKIAMAKRGKVVTDEDDPKKYMVIREGWDFHEDEEVFSTRVQVHVLDQEGLEINTYSQLIRFRIEFEYRSWGIKDVNIRVETPLFLNVREERNIPREERIEEDQITYEWEAGSFFGIRDLYVTSGPSVGVRVKCVYIDPNL